MKESNLKRYQEMASAKVAESSATEPAPAELPEYCFVSVAIPEPKYVSVRAEGACCVRAPLRSSKHEMHGDSSSIASAALTDYKLVPEKKAALDEMIEVAPDNGTEDYVPQVRI